MGCHCLLRRQCLMNLYFIINKSPELSMSHMECTGTRSPHGHSEAHSLQAPLEALGSPSSLPSSTSGITSLVWASSAQTQTTQLHPASPLSPARPPPQSEDFSLVQFSSVAQLCPGLPVHHKLPEPTQTHVH